METAKWLGMAVALAGLPALGTEKIADGHLSSWAEAPKLIESLFGEDGRRSLERLETLTNIQFGEWSLGGEFTERDQQQYAAALVDRWRRWWDSTGDPVSQLAAKNAKVDERALQTAQEFLGVEKAQQGAIPPVWIPETWVLRITFSNGDYGGREKELWLLDRRDENASLTKLRGDFSKSGDIGWGAWQVVLSDYSDLTTGEADQLLRALHYAHRHAPPADTDVPDNEMPSLYYPHSTIFLGMGDSRVLWNAEGYAFKKTLGRFNNGDSGRSYYFMRSVLDTQRWESVEEPTGEQLAPYRSLLASSKPYFFANAGDIVQLFGDHGGAAEQESLLDWADKQKAAADPSLGWKECYDDFGTEMKVNVTNFTRGEIQETLKEIGRIGTRVGNGRQTEDRERALKNWVEEMLALKKREEDERIQAFPLPLRNLIIADQHPDDSDLRILSAAINSIRTNPDQKLFEQLVERMGGGGQRINSLLDHIMLNELEVLELEPWGEEQEALAVNACIDAMPKANSDGKQDIAILLLKMSGGGKIEFQDGSERRGIDVEITEGGYRYSLGDSSNPPTVEQAQTELRRLWKQSRVRD